MHEVNFPAPSIQSYIKVDCDGTPIYCVNECDDTSAALGYLQEKSGGNLPARWLIDNGKNSGIGAVVLNFLRVAFVDGKRGLIMWSQMAASEYPHDDVAAVFSEGHALVGLQIFYISNPKEEMELALCNLEGGNSVNFIMPGGSNPRIPRPLRYLPKGWGKFTFGVAK